FALNGVANPSFAPDGKQIVFSGNDGGISDLFLTDLKGRVTRLTDDKFADLVPSWSPDGRTIAFTTDRGPNTDFEQLRVGNYRVALLDLSARHITVLPGQDQGKNHNPVWSPDSKQLVWVNDANGINNLHLYDIDKAELSRISDVLSGVIAIAPTSPVLSWSKSGRLLFNYFEKAGYNIYAVADPRTLPRIKVEAAKPMVAIKGDGTGNEGRPQALDPQISQGPAQPNSVVTSFYKQGSALRPSAQKNDVADIGKPISIVALMDSVSAALPDTVEFEHHDYKTKFTPDMIGRPTVGAQVGGNYGNGLYGGSFIALSDMLGNHHMVIAGNLNGSLRDASFLAGYAFLKTRANFSVALSQMPIYRYLGSGFIESPEQQGEVAVANVFLRDVIRTIDLSVSYPFSTFSRLELGAAGVYYTSDVLYRGYHVESGERLNHNEDLDRLAYWQPTAALVYDNSLFGWTGPMYGRRYRLQVSKPMGDFAFTEALLDFRNYANFKQSLVFATRFTALSRSGPDANRFQLYWGGPYFIRGYNAGSFELGSAECQASRVSPEDDISQCPIRDQLIGSSAAFFNAELRFPIIKQLQIGFLGTFPPVDLVTFFDGGVAWNTEICTRSAIIDPRQCAPGAAYD
ncbi:MAG TPA: BamA/TamA family outer membrane protein, partial [Longimicrobiales bacterium]